ncbi:acyl-CoA--sterol O-acyltransferase 1-like [Amaranthus tricolor]|uniref:acyl-CoA--sterol O-acyltransferase 1-like n=1 Tax=Amaranthus tricolor TaxID=29722 RepID=UPI00258FA44A|nr:acyl-CoA--sterol O-acyltransferase 1-like [Amaranthus tricolor]
MLELAQDELKNLGKVWLLIFVSLSYCYIIGKIIPKGFTRLVAILPVIILFLNLPLNLTSIHFCGFTSFFISWLANFKLLLFAFGKPPLCLDSPISFPLFLVVSCLPIKIQHPPSSKNSPKEENKDNPDHKSLNNSYASTKNSHILENNHDPVHKSLNNSYPSTKNSKILKNSHDPDHKFQNKSYPNPQILQSSQKLPWNYVIKTVLLALMIKIYDYSDDLHPKILWSLYFLHIYFSLEIVLAIVAKSANFFLGLELEPQFNEPLLSTSIQDFWGKRWNLMVTGILRPTVYLPTQEYFTKIIGRKTALLPAVMATFVVSALMHELIFYYLGREEPTFEVTWFFLLHGFCLCVEIAVKKYGRERKWWVPPRWLSGPLTVLFVVGTGFWLFLPPLLNAGLETRGLGEYAVIGGFIKRVLE